jgi:hypothetical protein
MIIFLNCTANLGDFMNAMPVLSGINKSNGKFKLIIRDEMVKFNGIKEFLMYQDLFSEVSFQNDSFIYGNIIGLSSWTREDRTAPHRPIETCRYETYLRDNSPNLQFEVDDDFEIKVDSMNHIAIETTNKYIIGDRWNHQTIDTRRNTNVVENGVEPDPEKVFYLDYNQSIMYNCNLIKNSSKPFITTFTGIGIIADLMNKETICCWDEDMRMWDGRPVEYDFERHYYTNRKSKLVYVKDVQI